MKTSLIVLAIVLGSISSLTLATPTNSKTAANNGGTVFEESFSTRKSFVVYPPTTTTTATPTTTTTTPQGSTVVYDVSFSTRKSVVIYPPTTTTTVAPATPSGWRQVYPVDDRSPSGEIARRNMTIEEWVGSHANPDVEALAISMSLLPHLRSELNPKVVRYSRLGRWNSPELPNASPEAALERLNRFIVLYPQLCWAFQRNSSLIQNPVCTYKLYVEPWEVLRTNGSTRYCRLAPLETVNCNVTVALLGTGIAQNQVDKWQARIDQFRSYLQHVHPEQPDRMKALEEASTYWFVFCLKSHPEWEISTKNNR